MENNDKMTIPYIAFEAAQTRSEHHIRALIKALIIAIALLFASNAVWLYAWVQYDYVGTDESSEITVDAGSGTANYIGQDGDITNGTDNGKNTETDAKQDK